MVVAGDVILCIVTVLCQLFMRLKIILSPINMWINILRKLKILEEIFDDVIIGIVRIMSYLSKVFKLCSSYCK